MTPEEKYKPRRIEYLSVLLKDLQDYDMSNIAMTVTFLVSVKEYSLPAESYDRKVELQWHNHGPIIWAIRKGIEDELKELREGT